MTNPIDNIVSFFSPSAGVRRAHYRRILSYYEGGKKDKLRKQRKEPGSGNTAVFGAGKNLREQSRYLDENHDISKGILNILVARIAGPNGVQVEPQPRRRDGSIHTELAKQIGEIMRDWSKRPEVTWRNNWASTQRLACRTWVRDGEILIQKIQGNQRFLNHGTRVPFSLELLEPDFLPMDFHDTAKKIIQGIEINDWGRPVAYHLYKQHPGDGYYPFLGRTSDTKRISADNMMHLAMIDRLHQLRGVSVFAGVMSRLDDLKDFDESIRIAEKVAASMAGFIRKGAPDQYSLDLDESGDAEPRDLRFRPGMIFDDLLPGEEIGTIDTGRPSANSEQHRKGQIRALSAGTYTSASSLSKDYDGSYSAQRQELVESWDIYGILQSEFIGKFVQPSYETMMDAAVASGQIVIPGDLDSLTLDDALYLAPQMPWVDPDKEAKAWERLERNGHASGPEIIRRRGRSPSGVLEQETAWREKWREKNELIGADPATDQKTQESDNAEENEEARLELSN